MSRIGLLLLVMALVACARQEMGATRYNREGLVVGANPYGDRESDFAVLDGQREKFADCYKSNTSTQERTGAGFEANVYFRGTGAVFKVSFLKTTKTNAKTLDCVKGVLMDTNLNPTGEEMAELRFQYILPN